MTGTILLVSGTSDQARLIQKFQTKRDKEAGIYNHSGLIFRTPNNIYVMEAAPIEGRKFKAAVRPTPLSDYTAKVKDGYKLLFLTPKFKYNEFALELIMMQYAGTPYDYDNLLRRIPADILFKINTYKRSARRMVCHEFSQFAWQQYFNQCHDKDWKVFPEWYKGNVSKLFHCDLFDHSTSLPEWR